MPKPTRKVHLQAPGGPGRSVCDLDLVGDLVSTREPRDVTCRRCIVIGGLPGGSGRTLDGEDVRPADYDATAEAEAYIIHWLERQVAEHQDRIKRGYTEATSARGRELDQNSLAFAAALITVAGGIIDNLKGVTRDQV